MIMNANKHTSSSNEFRQRFLNWLFSFPIVAVLLPIQGISFILWWVTGSYFGLDVYSSRYFPGADGWCDPATQGLGVHCWGDYYYALALADQVNPFGGDFMSPLTAAALTPFLFFESFSVMSGVPFLGVFLYLTTMAALISWSVWRVTRGRSLESRIILFSTIMFLAPPVLFALDRGNAVGFLVPLVIWLFDATVKDKSSQIIVSIALLSVIKPHFGLLALAIMLSGKTGEGLKAVVLGAGINLLAFAALWPESFPTNLLDWLGQLVGYQEYASVSAPWPQNVSFSQAIYVAVYGLDVLVGGALQQQLGFVAAQQGLWGMLVLVLVFLMIAVYKNSLSPIQVLIIAVSSISMAPSVSFYYYLVLVVPVLLQLNAQSLRADHAALDHLNYKNPKRSAGQLIDLYLWAASILSLILIPIPGLVAGDKIIATGVLSGGFWILAYAAILGVLLKQAANKKIKPNYGARGGN
jgi:hypothetical protein